jgi:uncharacterized membrane protein
MDMEWFAPFEVGLEHLVRIVKFVLETLSVICVSFGLLKTLQFAFSQSRRRDYQPTFNQIRLRFGKWLALALEFQLGADILATTIAPTIEELARLALIAVIRTFLNYFLGKELEAEYALQREHRALLAQEKQFDA